MSYLVDTDRVAFYLIGRSDAVTLLDQLRPQGIAISTITLMELLEGIAGSSNQPRAKSVFRNFMRRTRVLVVSRPVAAQAAAIRLDLRQRKRQINERTLDIIIAATAIEHGLTLVTDNRQHYQDISGLRLYDDASASRQ